MIARRNQSALTADERAAFVAAVLELKRNGTYDAFVRQHDEIMWTEDDDGERVAHRAPSFLPWHRRYLLDMERALQAVDPSVSIPYWDFTVDASTTSALWADDFLGGNGRGNGAGDSKVMTGPFAYDNGNWPINYSPDHRPFLRRNFHGGFARGGAPRYNLPTPADVRQALAETVYDVEPFNSNSATGFRNRMEGWLGGVRLHNLVHNWVGGNMATNASPNDPVFFLLHCFVDKLWADWQALHPDAGYLPLVGDGKVTGLDEPMKPWPGTTPRDMLDHTKFSRYV